MDKVKLKKILIVGVLTFIICIPFDKGNDVIYADKTDGIYINEINYENKEESLLEADIESQVYLQDDIMKYVYMNIVSLIGLVVLNIKKKR